MPQKDGLDEPAVRAKSLADAALVRDVSVEILSRVIDLWNESEHEQEFIMGLLAMRLGLATGRYVIIYTKLDEEDEDGPEKGTE